jgi:hypothetical protein
VGHDQELLRVAQLVVGHARVLLVADAGGHAVDAFAGRQGVVHHLPAGVDPGARGRSQRHPAPLDDGQQLLDGERRLVDRHEVPARLVHRTPPPEAGTACSWHCVPTSMHDRGAGR